MNKEFVVIFILVILVLTSGCIKRNKESKEDEDQDIINPPNESESVYDFSINVNISKPVDYKLKLPVLIEEDSGNLSPVITEFVNKYSEFVKISNDKYGQCLEIEANENISFEIEGKSNISFALLNHFEETFEDVWFDGYFFIYYENDDNVSGEIDMEAGVGRGKGMSGIFYSSSLRSNNLIDGWNKINGTNGVAIS